VAAAAPGTVSQTLTGVDGATLTVTLLTDPDTGEWADPAIVASGDWMGTIGLEHAGGRAEYAVRPGQTVARATLQSAGVPAPTADTFFGTTLTLAT
jgi:hypothetical protein